MLHRSSAAIQMRSERSATLCQGDAQVYEIDPLADPRWEQFLDSHPDASVFHTPAWLSALQRTYGFRPVVYTTSPASCSISSAQVFCRIDSFLTGRRLVSLPFSDHAAVLLSKDDARPVLSRLREQVDRGAYRYLEMRPAGDDAPAGLESSETFYWHTLALDGDLDSIYRNFHPDCVRRKIRRAEREGLVYSEGSDEAFVHQFYQLSLLTHRRHGSLVQPIGWFRNLVVAFPHFLKIRLVSHRGRAIAAMITLSFKKTMTFKYGCSDSRFHALGGTALLFWKSIREAKELGLREFDMGRTDIGNPGLAAFKEHWGAHKRTLYYWRYPFGSSPLRKGWRFKAATCILRSVPPVALGSAGTLLYKHLG